MTRLLALDPGASVTGFAAYELEEGGGAPTFEELIRRRLRDSGAWKLKAHGQRKDLLYCELRQLLERLGPQDLVVVERPSWHGTYHRNRSMASVAGIHIGLGLTIAAAAAAFRSPVHMHEAAKVTKDHRWAAVAMFLGEKQLDPNRVDAIFLGAHYVHHKM